MCKYSPVENCDFNDRKGVCSYPLKTARFCLLLGKGTQNLGAPKLNRDPTSKTCRFFARFPLDLPFSTVVLEKTGPNQMKSIV